MKYLVINKKGQFIGVNLHEYNTLELDCIWNFWSLKELKRAFKTEKIMTLKKYNERS